MEKVLQQARVEKGPYSEAELRQGDHNNQNMLDDAVGSKLKKWWQFW